MSMLDVSLANESGLDYDEYMSDDLEGLTEEDFEDEEFEDEEDDEFCGSSCSSSKPKKVSLVSLQGLKSHFDEVALEKMDDFNLLTLRDKANKSNYDWIVWLQVKIPFASHNTCSINTDEEYIEGVCKEIQGAKDLNQYKARANAHAKLGNSGGSGYSIDGFRGSYSLWKGKKGDVITVTQSIEQRLELNRAIEGLEASRGDEVYVWKLNFQQVLEEAYRLFNTKPKQTSLFDFLAT